MSHTATDERSNWLRNAAPVVGGINRQLRNAASRLEHTRIHDHTGRIAADFEAGFVSAREIEHWAVTLETIARRLRGHKEWLAGPRQLTAYGRKMAAQFVEEDDQPVMETVQ